jgi:hypothetical protein
VASSNSRCACHYNNNNGASTNSTNSPRPKEPENKPTRENLNYILQARFDPAVDPLIDASDPSLTYTYDRYSRKQLDELATDPSLQTMKIVHKEFPWEIIVHSRDSRGVTVRDVLDTIYNQLNIPVSEEDANNMRGHWLVMQYRDRTSDARRSGDRYTGLKRMHWMRLESHAFIGLEPYKTDKWLMKFEDKLPE